MDRSAAIRRAALHVAWWIHHYAKAQGWHFKALNLPDGVELGETDYALFITVNEAWATIRVELIAGSVTRESRQVVYASVDEYLAQELAHVPSYWQSLTLVVMSPEEFDQWGGGSTSEGVVEVDQDSIEREFRVFEKYPNPSALERARASHVH